MEAVSAVTTRSQAHAKLVANDDAAIERASTNSIVEGIANIEQLIENNPIDNHSNHLITSDTDLGLFNLFSNYTTNANDDDNTHYLCELQKADPSLREAFNVAQTGFQRQAC